MDVGCILSVRLARRRMKKSVSMMSLLAILLLNAPNVQAQTTDWVDTLGAKMRVHYETLDDASGWRAVLDVELEPGWKTYWVDPGYNGIPPQVQMITRSGDIVTSDLVFPSPSRLYVGDDSFAGYEQRLRLGIVPTKGQIEGALPQRMSVFLGLCSDICVPFQTEFTFDQATTESAQKLTSFFVNKSFSEMPRMMNTPLSPVAVTPEEMILMFDIAEEDEAELFISGVHGWLFKVPRRDAIDDLGRGLFTVPIIEQGNADTQLPFTLVNKTTGEAISGTIATN